MCKLIDARLLLAQSPNIASCQQLSSPVPQPERLQWECEASSEFRSINACPSCEPWHGQALGGDRWLPAPLALCSSHRVGSSRGVQHQNPQGKGKKGERTHSVQLLWPYRSPCSSDVSCPEVRREDGACQGSRENIPRAQPAPLAAGVELPHANCRGETQHGCHHQGLLSSSVLGEQSYQH